MARSSVTLRYHLGGDDGEVFAICVEAGTSDACTLEALENTATNTLSKAIYAANLLCETRSQLAATEENT